MENKNCECSLSEGQKCDCCPRMKFSSSPFYIAPDDKLCGECVYRVGGSFAVIPTPNKMIEVEGILWNTDMDMPVIPKKHITIKINPTQPAIQEYIAQEIKRQGLIPRTDAVKYVEIDEENIREIFSEDGAYSYEDIGEILRRIRTCNPLELKQQGEGK